MQYTYVINWIGVYLLGPWNESQYFESFEWSNKSEKKDTSTPWPYFQLYWADYRSQGLSVYHYYSPPPLTKGVSQKKLEEETGCKILVRGRGS